MENATHKGSGTEVGKATAAHKGVTGWEYFVKTVQIDGQVFDLLANVRKKPEGEYVYSIQLRKSNQEIPAALSANGLPASKQGLPDTDSISQDGGDVNGKFSLKEDDQTQSVQFKQWFGDWQNDPEHASKVVDEDGKPLVVYHGTDLEFTKFDRGKTKAFYLKIKSPLVVSADTKANESDIQDHDVIIQFAAENFTCNFYNYETDTMATERLKKVILLKLLLLSHTRLEPQIAKHHRRIRTLDIH